MLTYSLGKVYNNYIKVVWNREQIPPLLLPEGYYLYAYSHEETIFYVGRSIDPIERLMQHTGRSYARPGFPDAIGMLINDNLPDSGLWNVTFHSLEDFIETPNLQGYNWLQRYREHSYNSGGWPYEKYTVAHLEEYLIGKLRPCLNEMNNKNGQILPERYIKEEIQNKGKNKGIRMPDQINPYPA